VLFRSKDKPAASSEDAFVNEIVQLANGTTQDKPKVEKVTKPKVDTPNVEKATKAEKPKAEKPKAEKPKVEKPKVEKPKVEKPKTDKPKTTKAKTTNDNDTPSQLNTEVSVLNLNDQQFLIDDHLNVYHFQNHSFIGKFDPNLNAIIESK
jgi:outer membrane biosynthesis protein TonB